MSLSCASLDDMTMHPLMLIVRQLQWLITHAEVLITHLQYAAMNKLPPGGSLAWRMETLSRKFTDTFVPPSLYTNIALESSLWDQDRATNEQLTKTLTLHLELWHFARNCCVQAAISQQEAREAFVAQCRHHHLRHQDVQMDAAAAIWTPNLPTNPGLNVGPDPHSPKTEYHDVSRGHSLPNSFTPPPPPSSSSLPRSCRLSSRSSEYLRAWFVAHKAHPYPTLQQRHEIATETGLSERQVHNWFANVRKRVWNPPKDTTQPTKRRRTLVNMMLQRSD